MRDTEKKLEDRTGCPRSCKWPKSFYHWFYVFVSSCLLSLVKLVDLPLGSQHNLSFNGFAMVLTVEGDLPVAYKSNLRRQGSMFAELLLAFPLQVSVNIPPHCTYYPLPQGGWVSPVPSNLESLPLGNFPDQILINLYFLSDFLKSSRIHFKMILVVVFYLFLEGTLFVSALVFL